MTGPLEGRRALVTGSTQGIGYAIAAALIERGASVIVHGTTPERAEAAATSLDAPSRVQAIGADISTEGGTEELLAALRFHAEPVDILVNNAGRIGARSVLASATHEFVRTFQTNALSGTRLAQALLPSMLKRDCHGRIVWITSEAARMPSADMAPYVVSKAAEIVMARMFAEVARGTTVTSNALLVGPTETEGAEAHLDREGIDWEQVMERYPGTLLGRPATAAEVADVAAFLASPESSVIRGAVVPADGGVIPTIG